MSAPGSLVRRHQLTATVTYEDRHAVTHSEAFVLDLAYLNEALWLDKHGLHHIAKTLRAMAQKSGINSF
ncbi:hypothetical protein QSU92_08620 [Microbacterium sp. ET2]|uniref:hypothetical protein n=1 Tax=Microbacterium albipurpureum TaxID=3050384 RepID=UPI00259C9176|nr:hypothetical protein [Microbacterium sp. ET2 (Ac-2212)]WJL97204.1 hypothetical protein QSU92_08620 [Microbacterium sp. ET2 (Ac-2212)]